MIGAEVASNVCYTASCPVKPKLKGSHLLLVHLAPGKVSNGAFHKNNLVSRCTNYWSSFQVPRKLPRQHVSDTTQSGNQKIPSGPQNAKKEKPQRRHFCLLRHSIKKSSPIIFEASVPHIEKPISRSTLEHCGVEDAMGTLKSLKERRS